MTHTRRQPWETSECKVFKANVILSGFQLTVKTVTRHAGQEHTVRHAEIRERRQREEAEPAGDAGELSDAL